MWSFVTQKAEAINPQPPDAGGGIPVTLALLQWTPFPYAGFQTIYFITSRTRVQNGTGGVALGAAASSWDPCSTKDLDVQTTYYWKIRTTVNAIDYDGPIWSFTTAFPMNFCDTFTASWDYWAAGGKTTGTMWDGVIGDAYINIMNTDFNSGRLRIEGSGNWSGRSNQGILLYKEVSGPYIAQVEVTNYPALYYPGWPGETEAVTFITPARVLVQDFLTC